MELCEYDPTCASRKVISTLRMIMAERSIKSGFVGDETFRGPGKLRTAKEARQLLEELRNAYQSLTPDEQCGVRSFMSDLLESQRRFGSTGRD